MTPQSGFKDHFSEQSEGYARHRPRYPGELFAYLATLTHAHALAWDCATGNGQAAVALADHYDNIIATDASAAQIDAAVAHASVDYRVATAEESGIDSGSVDLVAVGQALHWFDVHRFGLEARRVLVDNGVLAVWCYELCKVNDDCDAVVNRLYVDIVGGYWQPERRLIENGYDGIELPGERIASPQFDMTLEWRVDDMLGYLRTWSASNLYAREFGADPVSIIENDLSDAWGGRHRTVSWPLTLRASRID